MKYILDEEDIVQGSAGMDYTDKICVIRTDFFKPEYRNAKSQLFKATGGFGCKPENLGTKIFGTFLDDGEEAMVRRHNVLGIATDECIEKWKATYGKNGGK